jgi:hypothetical protein
MRRCGVILRKVKQGCDFSPTVSRCLPNRRRERFAQPLPINGNPDAGAFLLQEHHDA